MTGIEQTDWLSEESVCFPFLCQLKFGAVLDKRDPADGSNSPHGEHAQQIDW
jgi:hypothetical protein